jgi:hypothetical protein
LERRRRKSSAVSGCVVGRDAMCCRCNQERRFRNSNIYSPKSRYLNRHTIEKQRAQGNLGEAARHTVKIRTNIVLKHIFTIIQIIYGPKLGLLLRHKLNAAHQEAAKVLYV